MDTERWWMARMRGIISVPSDADVVGSIASGTFLEAINGTGARVHEAADTPALIAIAVPLAPKHAFARVCLTFDGMRIVDALRALSAIPARGCWLAQAAVTARFLRAMTARFLRGLQSAMVPSTARPASGS